MVTAATPGLVVIRFQRGDPLQHPGHVRQHQGRCYPSPAFRSEDFSLLSTENPLQKKRVFVF